MHNFLVYSLACFGILKVSTPEHPAHCICTCRNDPSLCGDGRSKRRGAGVAFSRLSRCATCRQYIELGHFQSVSLTRFLAIENRESSHTHQEHTVNMREPEVFLPPRRGGRKWRAHPVWHIICSCSSVVQIRIFFFSLVLATNTMTSRALAGQSFPYTDNAWPIACSRRGEIGS